MTLIDDKQFVKIYDNFFKFNSIKSLTYLYLRDKAGNSTNNFFQIDQISIYMFRRYKPHLFYELKVKSNISTKQFRLKHKTIFGFVYCLVAEIDELQGSVISELDLKVYANSVCIYSRPIFHITDQFSTKKKGLNFVVLSRIDFTLKALIRNFSKKFDRKSDYSLEAQVFSNIPLFPISLCQAIISDKFNYENFSIKILDNSNWKPYNKVDLFKNLSNESAGNKYNKLKHVQIFWGWVIVDRKHFFNCDPAIDCRYDFISGVENKLALTPLLLNTVFVHTPHPEESADVEKALILFGRNYHNWFHCLIEYLPAAYNVKDYIDTDTVILIPQGVPKAAHEILNQIFPNNQKLVINDQTKINITELYIPFMTTNHHDTVLKPWSMGVTIDSELIKRFSNYLIFNNLDGRSNLKKLFIDRGFSSEANFRYNLISSRSRFWLKNQGYKITTLKGYTLQDQVNTFNALDSLVSPSGAALSNIIFCKPGTEITLLLPKVLMDFIIWEKLGEIFNLRIRKLEVPQINNPKNPYSQMHASTFVPDKVIKSI